MQVFLIHGLGRTSASMWLLERRLRGAGYQTSRFGYVATLENLDQITERFLRRLRRTLTAGEPYAVIGHSLGNLVTRIAGPRLPDGFRCWVMLAPPNQPPAIARTLRQNLLFRFFTRDAGRKLSDPEFYARLPPPAAPALIIAGTRGPRAAWLPFRGEPNDSIVRVEETRLAGVPVVEVPGVHTFLMNRADVFAEIRSFFRQQGLEPDGGGAENAPALQAKADGLVE